MYKKILLIINIFILCLICTKSLYAFSDSEVVDWELFLDETNIESKSGLTLSVNRPVKSASNPITSFHDDGLWDGAGFWHPLVRYVMSDTVHPFHAYYLTASTFSSSDRALALCYSANITSGWTRKNDVGLYDFGTLYSNTGTDNNIVIAPFITAETIHFFPNMNYNWQYIAGVKDKTPGSPYTDTAKDKYYSDLNLWASPDEENSWAFIKAIFNGVGPHEPKDLIDFPDGTLGLYFTEGHSTEDRETHLYQSDTPDLIGTWTDKGPVIPTSTSTNQKYWTKITRYGEDNYIGVTTIYNSTTQMTPYQALYFSRDGLTWTSKDTQWLALGGTGTWDSKLLYTEGIITHNGLLYVIYMAGDDIHDGNQDYYEMGVATLDAGRIGEISGAGTYTTDPIGIADFIYINCLTDSGTGTIGVELLNASTDAVISGYAKADCDTVSEVDSTSHQVSWSDSGILPDSTFKAKFYFGTGAELYSYKTVSPRQHTAKITFDKDQIDEADTYLASITDVILPSLAKNSDGVSMQSGGGDIIVAYNPDLTDRIPCDVIKCVPASDPANAKIQVVFPANFGTVADADIYIGWGTENTSSQPAADEMYGKDNVYNYLGTMVYNMDNDPSGAAPQLIDSSRNDVDGTSHGTMTSGDLIDSIFGPGIEFDGSDDYFNFGDVNEGIFDGVNHTLTVSVIFEDMDTTVDQMYIEKYEPNDDLRTFFCRIEDDGKISAYVQQSDPGSSYNSNEVTNSSCVTDGNDYLITITFDLWADDIKIYVNGAVQASTFSVLGTKATFFNNAANDLQLGGYINNTTVLQVLNGPVAFFTMEPEVQSTDYISTCYNLWLDTANTATGVLVETSNRRRIMIQ